MLTAMAAQVLDTPLARPVLLVSTQFREHLTPALPHAPSTQPITTSVAPLVFPVMLSALLAPGQAAPPVLPAPQESI